MTKKYFERIATLVAILFFVALPVSAQRYVDKIDRGLVAVPASQGNLVSWRIFGEEYYDVTYNLYINGTLAAEHLTVSNYNDTAGNASTTYQVAAVVRGTEQEKCAAITRWDALDSTGAIKIPVQDMTGRDGTNTNSYYTLNDISLGDLTGDGVVEFIVKRPCDLQLDTSQSNCFEALDAYDRFGNRLWWIDMGPNMCSGPDEQWDCIAYDWDLDGKAEVLLRGADNMIIHSANGDYNIGDMTVDTRSTVLSGSQAYTNQGAEYLLYLNGETGEPYAIGDGDTPYWIDYPNPRGEVLNNSSNWGDNYGHRATKHYFGAPYLDGRHPSIFLGRGCYTKHLFKAFDVDPTTHKLTQRWAWECTDSSSEWYGNGFHNFAIADVDWDGKDEIVFGSMVIDDTGMGLCTTGLGHGDAQHCSNFDPYRHGQQQFTCCEDNPNMQYYDATTGEMFYRSVGTGDDGRCLMGNFTNDYPGSVGRSTNTGWIGATSHKVIDALGGDNFINWADLNQRIYWDGDLLDEYFDSPGTEKEGRIYKPAGGYYTFSSSLCANDSKNDPGAIADIFGDWREELVMRSSDDKYILVYTTPVYSEYGFPTLWSDHQYRNSIVWQSMGYNQPPHKSYFVGEMEGITVAPPPLIMTDRTEVANGGTIGSSDDHLIVCEWNDTQISITDGASPYMVTFYIPSNVTGNAASNAKSNVEPTYEYYTCNVTGGALTGSTRLVKQGDGILNLPKVDMTYTGETNIWAGILNFDGTLKNSPLWLNRFAELNSDGGEFKSISADYGAILRPGGEGNISSITADAITLGFGSHVEFDIDCSTTSCDQLNATTLTIETKSGTAWENYGPEYLCPVFNISATNTSDGAVVDEGTYVLGTVGTVVGSLDDIKIMGVAGQSKSLSLNDKGELVLTVAGVRDASTVYWNGNESDTWNYANTANFLNTDGENDIFVSGDVVYFTDDAQTYSVTLVDELDPSEVIVDSEQSYTFGGTGSLTGDIAFSKQGSGTLTIGNDNTYTGTNTLSGGTVKVSSLANSTQAAGNLGGPNATIVMENGATLQTTSAVTLDAGIQGVGDDGGIINNSAEFTMNGIISGTIIDKQGSGTLKVNKSNSVSILAITKGDVEVVKGKPASTVEFRGGNLYDDVQNTGHAIDVPEGMSGTWYLTTEYYTKYANTLTGSGTLTIIPRNTVNRVSLAGNWSNFYGTIKHTTSSIVFPLNTSTSMSHLTLDIRSNCEVSNAGSSTSSGRTLQIGAVTGKGILREYFSDFNSQTTIANTTTTWQIGNDDGNDFTFSGNITDSGTNKCAFTKVGSCTMTMNGSSTFQGAAKVEEGELIISSTSTSNAMLGTGALTVSSGAILSGKGLLTNASTTVNEGGRLCCGTRDEDDPGNGAGTPGVFQFDGKNVTVNGTLEIHINNSTTEVMKNVGTLTLNGDLTLKGEMTDLELGDEVKIIDASSIVLGSDFHFRYHFMPNNGEFAWDTSRLNEGILVVMDVPEGIETVSMDSLDNATIYTLQGVRLDTRPTRAGVYIVNGVKTVLH